MPMRMGKATFSSTTGFAAGVSSRCTSCGNPESPGKTNRAAIARFLMVLEVRSDGLVSAVGKPRAACVVERSTSRQPSRRKTSFALLCLDHHEAPVGAGFLDRDDRRAVSDFSRARRLRPVRLGSERGRDLDVVLDHLNRGNRIFAVKDTDFDRPVVVDSRRRDPRRRPRRRSGSGPGTLRPRC